MQQELQVKATVEAVGVLSEITALVFGEVEGMLGAGQCVLEVAQQGIDPTEIRMLNRLSVGADDFAFVLGNMCGERT